MKIDSNLIKALSSELNEELAGGRINKIQQPAKDILILTINKRKLLISVRGNYSRINITDRDFEFPSEPPMFCMLLRKYISNALIVNISQLNNDRIIKFDLNTFDDIGRDNNYSLIIELIPKCSNVILIDSNQMIIDCLRRRDFDADMYRRVYPNNLYRLPIKKSSFELKENIYHFENVSRLLDDYFSDLENKEIISGKAKDTKNKINSAIKRIERKIGQQKIELQNTYSREDIKRKADLIIANIYKIKKGDKLLICEDFYGNYNLTEIELDSMKSPQDNASKLYKEYNKMKKAEVYLSELIDKGEQQLDYLYSTRDLLNRCTCEKDINDIKDELSEYGFIKENKKITKKREIHQKPIEEGKLMIGRNNKQNDELTFKIADKNFWWFHIKGYHGSHVILKEVNPTEEELMNACIAAVIHSEAEGKCAVDYCQVKYVKKPKGALPGKVIYTNFKTKLVN